MHKLECMENEALIRLGIFLGLFTLFALIETLLPRRERVQSRRSRWTTNISITVLNTLTLRFMAFALPVMAVRKG